VYAKMVVMHQPPAAPPTAQPWQVTTTRTFPAIPGQASAARRFLARFAEGFPAADDALLCLSEVATNAIQHSHSARPGGQFTVRATRAPGRLRVEVEDQGGPWKPQAHHHDHGGRGLAILTALTTWDATANGDGHRIIWFEITP
jgi:serine/threonine-protein kinase RsbW